MGNMTATIEELYYRQAIMNKEEKKIDYTFSIPLNKEYSMSIKYCKQLLFMMNLFHDLPLIKLICDNQCLRPSLIQTCFVDDETLANIEEVSCTRLNAGLQCL